MAKNVEENDDFIRSVILEQQQTDDSDLSEFLNFDALGEN